MRMPPRFVASAVLAIGALWTFAACPGDPLPGGADLAGGGTDLAAADLRLGERQCRVQADCTGTADRCLAPDESAGCGVCQRVLDPCQSDAECAAQNPTSICSPVECACGGESRCGPGCTADAQCAAWQVCSSGHRCLGRPCTKSDECPTNYACTTASDGTSRCGRRACTTDAECQGYCVKGRCYDRLGMCTPPVP